MRKGRPPSAGLQWRCRAGASWGSGACAGLAPPPAPPLCQPLGGTGKHWPPCGPGAEWAPTSADQCPGPERRGPALDCPVLGVHLSPRQVSSYLAFLPLPAAIPRLLQGGRLSSHTLVPTAHQCPVKFQKQIGYLKGCQSLSSKIGTS